MIHEHDYPILRAFLEREASMYQWKPNTNNRQEFIDRMFDTLVNKKSDNLFSQNGYNYIHIVSLSNMGLVTSELVLSGHPWDSGTDLQCLLPPSPRGGIGFQEEDHGI